MGRGRAKAKQTKVARELKYNSGGINIEALRAELVHDGPSNSDDVDPALLAKYADSDTSDDSITAATDDEYDDEDDQYASR